MIEVQIYCPECKETGYIKVRENIVKDSSRGITGINVAEFLICEHSFIVYLDKNFTVRDSFISDFKIELPSIILHEKERSDDIDKILEAIDPYLIIINLSALTLASIIRGLLFKRKLVLIHEIEIIGEHLMKLLQSQLVKRNYEKVGLVCMKSWSFLT